MNREAKTRSWANKSRADVVREIAAEHGYEGEFLDGLLNGRGVHTWADGGRYEGEYRDGIFHGRGVFAYANGNRYEGEYRDGRRNGRGVYMWADGARYEGEYRDDKPHGQGTLASGGVAYSGIWWNGCLEAESRNWAVGTTMEECGF